MIADIADIYELSPIQAGMLFHRVSAPESQAYFDQFSCQLAGPLDVHALRQAWQALVDHHDVLRTSFHWEGLDKPVQVVHREAALPWTTHDWRHLDGAAQQAEWTRHLAGDRVAGFTPDAAPLMRCCLARLDEHRYWFSWSHHHLLLDGWCLTLVLSELFTRYEALITRRTARIAAGRPYREYIDWLQKRDTVGVRQYWRDALAGFSAATPLPGDDRAAPSAPAWADAATETHLSESLTSGLRALAAARHLTLNTLMQGAWALLLSRCSSEHDVVFGTTVSGRPPELPGIETMLGVFINTVPVRVQIDPDADVGAWLARLQSAQAVRDSFATLALSDIQKLSVVEPGSPLFLSNLIVMNYRLDEALVHGAAGIEVRDVTTFDQTDVPLTLQVTPGRRLSLELAYDSHRFDPGAIRRMLGHLERVLEAFHADVDRPLSAIDILTDAERVELVSTFNATAAPLDPAITVVDLWERQAAATPEAVALTFGDVRLSYRALNERANQLARALMQQTPIGRDDRVAIALERSDWMVAAMLAAWKCGAAYVPVDPGYPEDRVRRLLEDADPRIVLRDDEVFAGLIAASRAESGANLGRSVASSDLAYVIFTSGSTGRPKGAMIEHLGMMNHMLAKIETFDLAAGAVVVQNASHCFDVSVWQFFAAMLAGGTTAIYGDDLVLDPDRFLDRLDADEATILEVVPSYLSALLDRLDAAPRPLRHLRWLLVTGEMVTPALLARWFSAYPSIPAVNAYGPTEAGDDVTQAVLHEAPDVPTVPVGRPLRNLHIYVVDEQMHLCPVGIKGEICVSGAGVGRGYLNDPARTAAVFIDDPFRPGVRMYRTGDVGAIAPDGMVLMFGRRDSQVKVRGYRIELGDVEAAVSAIDIVREAAVVERRDRAEGSYLAAYVTLREGASAAGQEILDRAGQALPGYMVPSTCTVLAEMPLTPNGKIDRKALPMPDMTPQSRATEYEAARTPVEALFAGIWRDVLGIERPGIHDNFFALGGDSIVSMQIASRASRAGFAITPRDVFEHQTIADLARAATPKGADRPSPASATRPTGPVRLAPAQQQFFEDVVVDRHHYNQSILIDVPASFAVSHFGEALAAVVARHDALRLRFRESGGRWEQRVAETEPARLVTEHDLSAVPPEERTTEMTARANQLHGSLSITTGPLVQAAYFRAGPAESGRVLIAVHHLAMDGVSWRILLDDLQLAYEQRRRGDAIVLPEAATSYVEWADALTARAAAMAGDAAHWTAGARGQVSPLSSADRAADVVGAAVNVEVVFDRETTSALLGVCARTYDAGATELLLASAGVACARAFGQHRLLVDLETHGREYPDLDLTRTVGWFTSTFPVLMNVPDEAQTAPHDLIRDVKGQLQSAPAHAQSYGLLRFCVDDSPLAALPRAEVLFNYHGRVDRDVASDWTPSLDADGAARSLRQRREYLVEINGLVSGGELRVVMTYGARVVTPEQASALARAFRAAVDGLVTGSRSREESYDLSPAQHGMLFHSLLAPASQVYFNQLTCVLTSDLDVTAFQSAWQAAADRHAALRTSFHWQGRPRPTQVVASKAEAPWTIHDWTGLTADDQERRWRRELDEDRARPFDLSSPPLMRFGLSRIAPRTYWFRWSQHHLLLDGWSSAIVLNDVLAAYEIACGAPATMPPLPRPFRDHVDWLRRQDPAGAERFWRGELAGFTSATPLVLGAPELDGVVEPSKFAEAESALPSAQAEAIRSFCGTQRLTLNTLFQAVWALLLARYSGESDVVFGSIVSGRPSALAGSDAMVGVFINTIPVRVRMDANGALGPWVRDLQRANGEREAYSYCSLADVQRWSDVDAGATLFESLFIFENYPVAEASAGERLLAVGDVRAFEPNNYPLTFVVTPGARIGLKVMYDEGRFDRATVDRMLEHAAILLSGMLEDPGGSVASLPILSDHERRQILSAWNDTAKTLPAATTVLQLIEDRARTSPARTAVTCDGRTLTYAELNARANQLARVLTGFGAARGACVAVLMRRSERLLETVLAIWKCGAVYVPVDPDYPEERIGTIIGGARAALVVAETDAPPAGLHDRIRAMAPVVVLEHIANARQREDVSDLAPPPEPDSVAYTIFTSGSTGVPKGAMVEHTGMLNHMLSMIDELGLGPASIVAQTASHCFDISMWQLFASLAAGGAVAIYPERVVLRPLTLAARLSADHVTVAQFVPSYLNVFMDALDDLADRPRLASLSHLVTIGEVLKHAAVERWFRLVPHVPLMNAYGPTEASDSIAHHDMVESPRGAVVPIGRPIQNMAIYVLDAAMRVCPVGVKGEMCVAGVGVGRGYLYDEARTAQAFMDDPFVPGRRMYRTGDLGCYAADGTLRFFGRRDFQVKIRGHRIEIGEIEASLTSMDGVRDAAVVARETGGGDRFLCAFVTPRAGSDLTQDGVTEWLSARLPRYAVPDVVRVLPHLPVMSNGKVDRRALTNQPIERTGTRAHAGATTRTEQALVRIWRDVLQHDAIGVDDTLFELGGHSLKAIEIASRVSRDCGAAVGVAEVLERATIRELARVVDAASRSAYEPIPVLPPQDEYDVSPTQKRMWLASRTREGSTALNMAGAFLVEGDLDVPGLRRACRLLLDRHEALRTVFVMTGGALRQRVLSLDAAGDVLSEAASREQESVETTIDGLRERAAAPFDLARGPLVGVELLRLDERRTAVLLRMHHTIGDALSIRVLLEELLALYAAARTGEPHRLPALSIQYRDFAAWQNARVAAASGAPESSREYWRRIVGASPARAGFTPDRPRPAQRSQRAVHVECPIDEHAAARLREMASRHETTLFGVVLAAIYALLYRHTAREDIIVGTQVSRRAHPQLERQIGCYIDTLLLRGHVRHDDTAAALVARAARVVREALAHQDYPFDALLDDLNIAVPPGRTPIFDVLVNYVPRGETFDADAERAGVKVSELPLGAESAQYETAFLIDEPENGSLSVRVVLDADLFDLSSADTLRDRLGLVLRWLVEDAATKLDEVELLPQPPVRPRRLRIQLNAE